MLFRNHYNTTDYVGGFIYKDNALEFLSQPEGYIEPYWAGHFNYVYQYKDHLEDGALKKCPVDIFSDRASWRVRARLSYNQGDFVSYLNDGFYNEYEDWYFQGGATNGSIELDTGRLKVNVKNAYNGAKFDLGDNFSVGQQVHIKLDLDTGNTDKVRIIVIESDGLGNWSGHELHPNAPTGSYSFEYSITSMHRLAIKLDKRPSTDNGTPTYFYIDNVSAKSGNLEIVDEIDEGYLIDRLQDSSNTNKYKRDMR